MVKNTDFDINNNINYSIDNSTSIVNNDCLNGVNNGQTSIINQYSYNSPVFQNNDNYQNFESSVITQNFTENPIYNSNYIYQNSTTPQTRVSRFIDQSTAV